MLYRTLSGPVSCQIEIDDRCNNNCIHCYNHWRHEKCHTGQSMDSKTLARVIEQLVVSKVLQVTITGGEPLLNKKILFEAIEELILNKIPCSVNSNLTLLRKTDVKTMFNLGMRGVMTSVFSFDKDKHDYIAGRKGAFDDVVEGIKVAHGNGLKVAVSMVITKFNENEIIETAKFLKKLGVTQFFATKASPPINSINFQEYMISKDSLVRSLDDLLFLEKNEKMDVGILECYPLCAYKKGKYHFATKRSCSAGITTCTIGANGDTRACSHSDKIFGNVLKERLKDIWHKMSPLREDGNLPNDCNHCEFLPECSGGCRIDSKYCFGSFNSLDPYAIPSEVEKIEYDDGVEMSENAKRRFLVNSKVILREEDLHDGVLIATMENPAAPSLITKDTYELLLSFEDAFTVEDFSNKSGLDIEESSELCYMFAKDGLLVLVN